MASKQLGKLRQWAGEVISSRDKTTVSEEFQALEKDIERRKDGIDRLHVAAELYHHSLSKKKNSEALDDPEKLLPIDILGIVMIVHGEEMGEDSTFGSSLVKLGRAHCKVATLQEAYALTFQDTFLISMQKFQDDIKEYEAQRKKLESRRLTYDAAVTKADKVKNSKKEKDKREADEELQKAKQRFDETSEDVRAHIRAVQDNQIDQLRELGSFLDMEINFVEQYLAVLKDVKSDWSDDRSSHNKSEQKEEIPTHLFSRPTKGPKFSSKRSMTSDRPVTEDSDESDGGNTSRHSPPSRKSSIRQRSGSTSRPSSRPSSRASRKRTDSVTTNDSTDKEKEKAEKSRRLSVSGWASAVGSVTGRSKKNKDKEMFAALEDQEADDNNYAGSGRLFKRSSSSLSVGKKRTVSKSKENMPSTSPQIPARSFKSASTREQKLVRALHDFSGSSDELSFRAGDEIIVLNEVLDEWWMGELNGCKGLFPTPYTEVISISSLRPSLSNRLGISSEKKLVKPLPSEDNTSKGTSGDGDTDESSDVDEDHVLHGHVILPATSPFFGHSDTASITSSLAEEEERQRLMPGKPSGHDDTSQPHKPISPPQRLVITPHRSAGDITSGNGTALKKAPPPPPPRRSTNNNLQTPPIPARRPSSTLQSQSSGSLIVTPASSTSSHGYDTSPFESTTEFTTGCKDFKQNPFKPKGMCSNCFEFHT